MSELKNSSVVSIASPHLLVGGPPVHAHAALALLLAVVVVEVEPALDQSQVSSGRHVTALSQSQLTWTRTCHWMQKAAMSMLRERAERPYFFRKVIRKPKPTKIITCTSWKSRNQPIENLNYLPSLIFVSYSAKFSRSCCGDDPLRHQTPRGSWGS